MARQFKKIEAEGGHQRGVVRGQKAGVAAHVRISGGQALGVVVGGGCRRALGIFHQRYGKFVRDEAQLVSAHVHEHV